MQLRSLKLFLLLAVFNLVPFSANAGAPAFTNLTPAQTDAAFKNFAAAFSFKPMEPASHYGMMGFSFGVIASLASTSVIKDAIPGGSFPSYLPSADIYLGFQLPAGVALEGGFVPNIKAGSTKLSKQGINLKWVPTATMMMLPVSVAIRGTYSRSKISYQQTKDSVTADVTYKGSYYGANASVGLPIPFIEPYAGIGFIHDSSTLGVSGSATFFDQNYTSSSTANSEHTSFWFYAGAELKLAFLTLTPQYDHMFESNVYSAKLGFKF
ncbi:MAG: DUF6588 family protein [Bacteriovoracia bacterium]